MVKQVGWRIAGVFLFLVGGAMVFFQGYSLGRRKATLESTALFLRMDEGRRADMVSCNATLKKQQAEFDVELDRIARFCKAGLAPAPKPRSAAPPSTRPAMLSPTKVKSCYLLGPAGWGLPSVGEDGVCEWPTQTGPDADERRALRLRFIRKEGQPPQPMFSSPICIPSGGDACPSPLPR